MWTGPEPKLGLGFPRRRTDQVDGRSSEDVGTLSTTAGQSSVSVQYSKDKDITHADRFSGRGQVAVYDRHEHGGGYGERVLESLKQ